MRYLAVVTMTPVALSAYREGLDAVNVIADAHYTAEVCDTKSGDPIVVVGSAVDRIGCTALLKRWREDFGTSTSALVGFNGDKLTTSIKDTQPDEPQVWNAKKPAVGVHTFAPIETGVKPLPQTAIKVVGRAVEKLTPEGEKAAKTATAVTQHRKPRPEDTRKTVKPDDDDDADLFEDDDDDDTEEEFDMEVDFA